MHTFLFPSARRRQEVPGLIVKWEKNTSVKNDIFLYNQWQCKQLWRTINLQYAFSCHCKSYVFVPLKNSREMYSVSLQSIETLLFHSLTFAFLFSNIWFSFSSFNLAIGSSWHLWLDYCHSIYLYLTSTILIVGVVLSGWFAMTVFQFQKPWYKHIQAAYLKLDIPEKF